MWFGNREEPKESSRSLGERSTRSGETLKAEIISLQLAILAEIRQIARGNPTKKILPNEEYRLSWDKELTSLTAGEYELPFTLGFVPIGRLGRVINLLGFEVVLRNWCQRIDNGYELDQDDVAYLGFINKYTFINSS